MLADAEASEENMIGYARVFKEKLGSDNMDYDFKAGVFIAQWRPGSLTAKQYEQQVKKVFPYAEIVGSGEEQSGCYVKFKYHDALG